MPKNQEPKMTTDDVWSSVELIEECRADYEAAHSREDHLHQRVLTEIATGRYTAKECKELAAVAIRTKEIEFARYTA